jgi:hypothetical protein
MFLVVCKVIRVFLGLRLNYSGVATECRKTRLAGGARIGRRSDGK